jgi:hypothetical protein
VTRTLRILDAPCPSGLPDDPAGFLRWLGGPAALHVSGRDSKRTRIVVTLLHGNEPSGLRALHRWLLEGRVPATNVVFAIGAVEAALTPPVLTHRAVPGLRDLNRCFRAPFRGPEGELACALLDHLHRCEPEAIVDLHNNTGHNPAYGVACRLRPQERALTGLFSSRLVHYDLDIGALMEMVAESIPTIVIEVGRAGDPAADDAAWRGLERFLTRADVLSGRVDEPPFELLVEPVRIEICADIRLAYGGGATDGADFVVDEDVDRHNFESLRPGTVIGWLREGAPWPVTARGADGRDRSQELFVLRQGRLETRQPVVPIMMTTDPIIASTDCLFYIVRPGDP